MMVLGVFETRCCASVRIVIRGAWKRVDGDVWASAVGQHWHRYFYRCEFRPIES